MTERQLEALWRLSENHFKLKNPLVGIGQFKFVKGKDLVVANLGKYLIAIKLKNILKGKTIYKFVVRCDARPASKPSLPKEVSELRFKSTAHLRSLLKSLDYNKKIKKGKQRDNISALEELAGVFKNKKHLISKEDLGVMIKQENLIRGKHYFEKIKVVDDANQCVLLCKVSDDSFWLITYSYRARKTDIRILDPKLEDILRGEKKYIVDFIVLKPFLSEKNAVEVGVLVKTYPEARFHFCVARLDLSSQKFSMLCSYDFGGDVSQVHLLRHHLNECLFLTSVGGITLTLSQGPGSKKPGKSKNGLQASPPSHHKRNLHFEAEALDFGSAFAAWKMPFIKPIKTFFFDRTFIFVYPQAVYSYNRQDKLLAKLLETNQSFFKGAKLQADKLYLGSTQSIYAFDVGRKVTHRLDLKEGQAVSGFALSTNGLLLIAFVQNSKTFDKKLDAIVYRNIDELLPNSLDRQPTLELMFRNISALRELNLFESDTSSRIYKLALEKFSRSADEKSSLKSLSTNILDHSRLLYNVALYKANRFVMDREKVEYLKSRFEANVPLKCLLLHSAAPCPVEGCSRALGNLEIKNLVSRCEAGHSCVLMANTGRAIPAWRPEVKICETCSLYFEDASTCELCNSLLE